MNYRKLKKFLSQKDGISYVIEEDPIGWYLIVYNKKNANKSSQDYLFDTLEEALFEAEDKFGILRNSWKEQVLF